MSWLSVRWSKGKVDRRWSCRSSSHTAEEQERRSRWHVCILCQAGQDTQQQQTTAKTTAQQWIWLLSLLNLTFKNLQFVLIIMVASFKFWSLFITVLPSVFKRAARKRREEVRGAEEVHEDENTATELPVDQVSLPTFSTAWCDHVIKC